MADAVLLSAGLGNIQSCVDLAVEVGLGIETMAFAYPHVLDGDVRTTVQEYRALLKPAPGPIALHGPFMDMAAGSPDTLINNVVKARFRQSLEIAHELQARLVVLHANFIAAIRTDEYRAGWQNRNVDLWGEIGDVAQRLGVLVAVENMWEFDPHIIGDVLGRVNHPWVRACLDVGHTRLYSDVAFDTWLEVMAPYLIHVHLNNNDGLQDNHRALNAGVVEYSGVIAKLRRLPVPPTMTLEMDQIGDMVQSLPYFTIAYQPQRD